MNSLTIGLQYGDEGKGRVSACFADEHDWYIRFNGGPNAGHTVYVEDKKYALHHLPAGTVLGKKVALDAGMVIDINKLIKECNLLGITLSDLHMSERVHLIGGEHREQDSNGSGIGSTKSGIAYAYADKVLRKGKRAKDYSSFDMLNLYPGLPPHVELGESAMYEGAQGVMLDVDYGCYPYVTSSSVFPSAVHKIDRRIGVMKAYTSRVGDGPPDVPDVPELRKNGHEFGTTTGRPRRCTWLLLEELEYAIDIAQPDEIVVTKLDVLEGMEIGVWKDKNTLMSFNSLDNYKEFLTTVFPKIKYFSESPKGDLIEV